MSSYFQSFSYTAPNGKRYNSYKDKNLIVVHFESGDSGEMETFLDMEPVYTDNAYGTRRFDYGAKYNSVATIRISVMKEDGKDFTSSEVRDFLRWTTGSRQVSYLDLSDIVKTDDAVKEVVQISFLGRITAVYQQKLDARTVGFVIEHTSVSPYGYSSVQYASCSFGQELSVNQNGVLIKEGQKLSISSDGILSNGSMAMFNVTSDGAMYLDNSVHIQINNESDDLSDYVYMDTIFTNNNSNHVVIKNQTLYEESDGYDGITEITGMHVGEVIKLHSQQFIQSSSGRLLGNNFNFIWPKLMPGQNHFIISGTGEGDISFSYRYPIKIGDCAMDVDVSSGGLCCESGSDVTPTYVSWRDIIGKPNTISGYGITDAYTITEVDTKIESVDVTIDEDDFNDIFDVALK